jgi:hypothetical protein
MEPLEIQSQIDFAHTAKTLKGVERKMEDTLGEDE